MKAIPRIGIIGCGLIGETHADCLKQLDVPIALVADSDLRRAEAFALSHNARATMSADELLRSPEIDAVYICTHHDTHASLAISAAAHGKNIFLEKPMALTERECREIVRAVRDADVICMTGFKLRFYPFVAKAKEAITAPTVLIAHVLDTRWPDESWANDPIKGGGNVLSQGCHAVDLVCELARSKPLRVFAEGGNLHHPGIDITDTLVMTLTFESGAVASLTIADAGESPVVGKFSFQMMDGTRSLHLFDRMRQLIVREGEHERAYTDLEETGFLNENREFIAALREGRAPSGDENAGLRATVILLRAIESAESHLAIGLEDLF